jgi:molybdenum cofactor biosynthesis enzyme MoaA
VGYIQPRGLEELWFHTGTACNLACPFCLEGSKPGDNRLQRISLTDVQTYMDEAAMLGVRQFSFTGGEPFIVKDFVNILHYAANLKPCLVLSNGTEPVLKRREQIRTLLECTHDIAFRISIDWPDAARHDAGRGRGSFAQALESLQLLHEMGFAVSVARQMTQDENPAAVENQYRSILSAAGIQQDIRLVAFPDFDVPGSHPEVPRVTRNCMTRFQTEATRNEFMCAFSKMIVKQQGKMRVYACTLVDDDPAYDLGGDLQESLKERITMQHHRCYTCFAYGASCSELD